MMPRRRTCVPAPHAKQDHIKASSPGETRRTGPIDTGWRIRARGNRARSRRKARRTLHQAGDRHRTFQGETSRSPSSAARTREDIGPDASSGPTGFEPGPSRKETRAVVKAIQGHAPRPETRGALCRFDRGTIETGTDRGTQAFGNVTKRVRASRVTDQGRRTSSIGRQTRGRNTPPALNGLISAYRESTSRHGTCFLPRPCRPSGNGSS